MINTFFVVFIIKSILMELQYYSSRDKAKEAGKELGCKGTHKNKSKFGPCATKKKYEESSKTGNEGEIEELVDFDGTPLSSKVPILDPRTTSPGASTMDKSVAATRITQDPLMRGYRVYYGESVVREEDMSDAYGYEESENLSAKDTLEYFEDMGFDTEEANDRTEEQGKDPSGELDKKSKFKNKKGFVGKLRLKEKKEFTKEEISKMMEDTLVLKSKSDEITELEKEDSVSPIIKNNIEALKNMALENGISTSELIKMIKNE
jgi:hypothetical protein